MLNINQNFDLKAPVFNFDRDYFNSVEELNAYDTSNIPNHFVTNVAGMLYQFTAGQWLPMISTTLNDPDNPDSRIYHVNLLNDHCHVYIDPDDDNYIFHVEGEASSAIVDSDGAISLYTDTSATDYPYIDITKEFGDVYKNIRLGITENESFGLTLQDAENKGVQILTDKQLTDTEQYEGYSPVDMSLTDGDNNVDINAINGFTHETNGGLISKLDCQNLVIRDGEYHAVMRAHMIRIDRNGESAVTLTTAAHENVISMGDTKFKISRPIDNSEGAVISGIKSLTAFTNPSATKVWATDGSIIDLTTYTNYFNGTTTADKLKSKAVEVTDDTNSVTVSPTGITATNGSATKVFATDGSIADLSTKANTSDLDAKANASDVLLKKSASGGYYIESNSNELGQKAFAANDSCTASGNYSFAEGFNTVATKLMAHAEGYGTVAMASSAHSEGQGTTALGSAAHAEGQGTTASGSYSHTEGEQTRADGYCSHAQGVYNVNDINTIHSVGIGRGNATRKNAEYIYAKNNTNSTALVDDPKNGYKYLIGVGGYDGISTDNTTYKSVQEVIADLTARIEQLETKVKALEAANTPA